MEEWMRERAQEILLRYPIIKFVEWHYDYKKDGLINIKAVTQLCNYNCLKILVKIDENNLCDHSFILGDYYTDIDFSRLDIGVSFPDLLLTCHKNSALKPYALIRWPLFIRRYFEGNKHVVYENSKFGRIGFDDLINMDVLALSDNGPIIDI